MGRENTQFLRRDTRLGPLALGYKAEDATIRACFATLHLREQPHSGFGVDDQAAGHTTGRVKIPRRTAGDFELLSFLFDY